MRFFVGCAIVLSAEISAAKPPLSSASNLLIRIEPDFSIELSPPRHLDTQNVQVQQKLKRVMDQVELTFSMTVGTSGQAEWTIQNSSEALSKCWLESCRTREIEKYLGGIEDYIELRERFARASFLLLEGVDENSGLQVEIAKNRSAFEATVEATRGYFKVAQANAVSLAQQDEVSRMSWLSGHFGVMDMYSDAHRKVILQNILWALEQIQP